MITLLPATEAAMLSGAQYEYFIELLDAAGDLVATVDVIPGGQKSSTLGSAVRDTITFTVTGWDGVAPETIYVGAERLYGEGTYSEGLYGDERRAWLRGLFLPLLTTVKAYETISYATGSETLLLGTFTLDDPAFVEEPDGALTVRCSGWDLAGNLIMDRFTTPAAFDSSWNVRTAISGILGVYAPSGMTFDLPTTAETCGKMVYLPGSGKSPWEACRQLAEMAEWNIFVNREGNVEAVELPAPGAYGSAVYTFSDLTNLRSLEYVPSAKELCNRVIVYGENSSGSPVVGVAEDTTSPYAYSAIGRYVTREQKSEKPTSGAKANILANSLLHKWGRLTVSVSGQCAPIPHLEVGDIVRIQSSELELDEDFELVQITVPLDATQLCSFTAARLL